MTDISAEQLLLRAMAAVGRYRLVQRVTVYGREGEIHVLGEGFADEFPLPSRESRISGGFICGDFEMTPACFEKMEPDGTWKRCEDPRPCSASNPNRKRR